MGRCLSGEASIEEEEKLINILKEDEVSQQQYEILHHLWKINDKADVEPIEFEKKEIEEAAHIVALAKEQAAGEEDLNKKNKKIKRKNFIFRSIGIAAILLLILTASILWLKKDVSTDTNLSINKIIQTSNGNRAKIILPDGTSVWLNSGSKLSYVNNFSGPLREVRLEGEAYFDVVKNAAKPFIVHTGGVNIKVLGTAFDVKSYPADKTVETTLLRGLVQVTREYDSKQKPVFLYPNEKIVIQKIVAAKSSDKLSNYNAFAQNEIAEPYHITALDSTQGEDAHIETAWLNNRLAFRGDNFEELAEKLERWYNVRIIFQDEKVKKLSFNGSFENETVEEAFTALKAASTFNFTIQGNEIIISSVN